MWNQILLDKWTDKALKMGGYDITIAEIRKAEGEVDKKGKKIKGPEPYYLKYPWKCEEDENKWLEYIKVELRKLNVKEDKIDVQASIIDMLIGLSSAYLFKPQNTLF